MPPMPAKGAAEERSLAEDEEALRSFFHDIRNPISAILGFAHLLENRHDEMSDEQRHKVLESLNRTAQRLSSIVDDFAGDRGSTEDR